VCVASEPVKAAQCFNMAREGVGSELFLRERLLQTEETQPCKLEVLYYLKVGQLNGGELGMYSYSTLGEN